MYNKKICTNVSVTDNSIPSFVRTVLYVCTVHQGAEKDLFSAAFCTKKR